MIMSGIEALAASNGEGIALRFEDKAYSYSALVHEIDLTVLRLRKLGVTNQTAISVYCENTGDIMVLYYAMAKIGGTFVPINAVLSASEVEYIIGHADARFLFSDKKLFENAATAVEGHDCQLLDIHSLFAEVPVTVGRVEQEKDVQENFLIIYTSGSTGVPKAVLFNQAAEVAGNQSLIDMWAMDSKDKLLVALPLGFLYGLSTSSSMAMQAGCETIVLRRFHPREVLEAIVKHRVTSFQGVPTMYSMMLEYAEQNDLDFDLSFMRLLISAGAPLSTDLRTRFARKFGKQLEDYYALTEVRPVFGKLAGDPDPVPREAIGKASPGVAIKVVDGNGDTVGPNVTGEILVRAPATTNGYYKAPEVTASAFKDEYFRTGDLGHFDERGFYYLTGRIKDIIIRGGANIAPAEVEDAILSHPAIQFASVLGIPDQKFGELPIAYIVSAPGSVPSHDELSEHCRATIAEFKVPVEFFAIDEMPLGNTGKIDKKALLKLWKEQHSE